MINVSNNSVTTIAGNSEYGAADGPGLSATFYSPHCSQSSMLCGVMVWDNGNSAGYGVRFVAIEGPTATAVMTASLSAPSSGTASLMSHNTRHDDSCACSGETVLFFFSSSKKAPQMQSLRRSLLLSPATHATASPLNTTPPTSVFAMSLLHKYPQLCNAPFGDIARAWTTTVDAAIRAHVPLAEQQALNNAHSGDGVPHPLSTQCGTGKYYVSHWAALHGFTNVLHHLVKLESDADVSASPVHRHPSPPRVMTANSGAGLVPLHYAAKGGQLAALQLISSSCHKDVNGWPVTRGGNTVATLAAGFGHEHILRWLYGMGGAHRSQLWAHEVNDQGRTPLHAAAQSGALSVVQLFLDLPPSLNAAEPCVALGGTAALATTTTAGQLTVRDHFGRNLAHYAAESGRANVLQLLHDYASTPAVVSGATSKLCADILRGTDHRGATAVHYTSRNPSASSGILPLLHEVVGLSLWELDRAGNAPAVWAVLGGKTKKHIECIGYMLARDRARTLATVTADGRRLLTLVRDKYGTEGAMFKELRSLGFSE